MSRTDLLGVAECERRVAWKVLYGIPQDDSEDTGDAAAVGLLFHAFIARALMAMDPDTEYARLLKGVSPGDAATLSKLYERHQRIESEHEAVTYKRVEYEIGITIPLSGRSATRNGEIWENQPVAIVVIARADAVGREADNTPAIIEHRTGKHSDRIDERETALYALSTARLLGVNAVAVHQHALGAEGGPRASASCTTRRCWHRLNFCSPGPSSLLSPGIHMTRPIRPTPLTCGACHARSAGDASAIGDINCVPLFGEGR